MTRAQGLQLGVLGPLRIRRGGEELPVGGAKQRAVLAVLLLRAGTVVPVERLVDDVWGDGPPPSAARSLESYVSRLRQLFSPEELSVARRGAGYCLVLGEADLDARRFERLAEDVSLTSAAGDDAAEVARLAAEALALWRGPALADVPLASSGRAEAERLEELRLHVLEQRFDAELALGRHLSIVGELQVLVGQNPYRERFVGQLMLALCRSGRQADALEVYERTRARLDADLGLQPSEELRRLSGRIVRQEPDLLRPTRPPEGSSGPVTVRGRSRRVTALVTVGFATAAALALTAHGSAPSEPRIAAVPNQLALVLPRTGTLSYEAVPGVRSAVNNTAVLYDLRATTFPAAHDADAADATAQRIARSGSGVVVVVGDGPEAIALAGRVRRMPKVRFLFLDASLRDLGLESVPNAAALRFADEQSSHLAGYLSALVERKNAAGRVNSISVVAGMPTAHTRRQVQAFTEGVHRAARDIAVRVDYSRELADPTACERLANRQIDDGADVVFAIAGRCGLGALAVARYRNVWGVGTSEDGVKSSEHVLIATSKEWQRPVRNAIITMLEGMLPMGRDLVFGLSDEYAVGVDMGSVVPDAVQSAVIDRCSELRAAQHSDPAY